MGADERREQSETMPHKKARQEVAEAGGVGGGKPAEEGGFLSAVASKIGATMSGANGGSGGEVGATMASDGEEGKRDGDGEPGEEGGFLSAVASKIGAAMSGANGGDGGGGNAAAASGGEDKEVDGFAGGGIFRKLLHSSPPAPPHVSGAMETEEEVKDRDVAGGEQAGILSAMATKIGMAMPGANGDDSHGGSGDDAKSSNGEAARGGSNGGEKQGGESNGGGILSAVASRIGVAVSGANGDRSGSAEDGAKTSAGDAGHGSKSEEKGRGVNGGRIVEQIISNLPSDDQAPDADEASLLIAIIED